MMHIILIERNGFLNLIYSKEGKKKKEPYVYVEDNKVNISEIKPICHNDFLGSDC